MANVRANKPPVPTDRTGVAKTRPYSSHVHQPTGSKMQRRIFKVKHGYKKELFSIGDIHDVPEMSKEEAEKVLKEAGVEGKSLQEVLKR